MSNTDKLWKYGSAYPGETETEEYGFRNQTPEWRAGELARNRAWWETLPAEDQKRRLDDLRTFFTGGSLKDCFGLTAEAQLRGWTSCWSFQISGLVTEFPWTTEEQAVLREAVDSLWPALSDEERATLQKNHPAQSPS
jgi:hypothetical protein